MLHQLIQSGPLPIINGVLTPINGLVHVLGGVITPFMTSRGPPCIDNIPMFIGFFKINLRCEYPTKTKPSRAGGFNAI